MFKIKNCNDTTIPHISLFVLAGLALVSVALALAILLSSIAVQAANAQNSSIGLSKTPTPNTDNKTVVVASPGAAAAVVTAGNKTIVASTPTASPTASKSITANFNRTGFTNLYVLTSLTGKTFPIKYDIKGGKLIGKLADKDRSTLVLVLNPGTNGGNMTIELPRNVIDSKGQSNADSNFQLKIDGKGVDYKEVDNNANARILSVNFSKDNRFLEIIGTQMMQQ